MKKILIVVIVLGTFLTGLLGQTAIEPTGSGTEGSPYQIESWQNLYWISQNTARWDKHYIQTANIVFPSEIYSWDNNKGWTPIGNDHTTFSGTYDGQNHSILGLTIERPATDYQGLFGSLTGTIKNLGLAFGSFSGVTGRNYVGALAGSNRGTIQNVYSSVPVTGSLYVGGLVGNNMNFDLTGKIEYCYSIGMVNGIDQVGGLIGNNSGDISNSYSLSDVYRRSDTLTNFGGFVGYFYSGTITNSYSTGLVKDYNNNEIIPGKGFTGFAGDDAIFLNCYWDTQTSGGTIESPTTSAGEGANLTGKTTAEMKTAGTFTEWDFTDKWAMSSAISFGGYPTLKWTGGYAVAPTSNLIAGLPNLVWIAEDNSRWAGSYTQTADFSMWTTPSWSLNMGWTTLGNSSVKFTGTYNGQGYTINNLYINRNVNLQGLFGNINNATVMNVGVINCFVKGSEQAGGLAGRIEESIVENCFSTGIVSAGLNNTGGLIGDVQTNSIVKDSYSTANVNGNMSIGGLVGRVASGCTVSNCYSIGAVSGTANLGGLSGLSSGTISNSFWNKITSGQVTSSGSDISFGKTTEEMTNASTTDNIYLLAGWDFAGETTNGAEDIWNIGNGRNNGYPYHNLQYPTDDATLPVTLSSFTAIYTVSNTVSIMWTTQSESNMIGYHILRAETDELRDALRVSDNIVRSLNQSTETNYSYTDETTFEDTEYFYWLQSAEYDGTMEFFGPIAVKTGKIGNEAPVIPLVTQLNGAYPNPFNPSTTISFDIAEKVKVTIDIFNIKGQKVKSLVNQEIAPGRHSIIWSGLDDNHRRVATGVYFYKMQAGKYSQIDKMLMMK